MRLIPPRTTFAADMNEEERALMGEHAAYMRRFYEAGTVLAYGPVLDPAGAFGIALLEVADAAEAIAFGDGDPTVLAGMNRYSIAPMIVAGAQGSRQPRS